MHDTSARLVERVLPAASYRQWVLTVPFPRRLRIARDPGELWAEYGMNPAILLKGAGTGGRGDRI